MLPPTPPAQLNPIPTLSAACSPTRGWGPCQALQDLPLTIPSDCCHRSIIRALPLHPRLERRLPVYYAEQKQRNDEGHDRWHVKSCLGGDIPRRRLRKPDDRRRRLSTPVPYA